MTVEAPTSGTSGTSGTTGTAGVRLGDAAGPGSRARLPDDSGVTTRDGVQLAWESFGCGATTVLLMPTWSIVPSRIWKGQVAYLARHFRVVTFDGRGSGASGRPSGATAYTNEEYAADAVAVMDAAGVEQAVLVSLSCGGAWSVHVATSHPERVLGLFAIAPSCGFALEDPHRDHVPWDERLPSAHGWEKYNKYYWLEGDYDDFVRFFFRQMFSEPHSTKQIEDAVAWGHEISPQTLADTTAGRIGCDGAVCSDIEALCRRVTQPVTVLHGSDDRIRGLQYGERLAELTGGELVVVEGAGHGPLARDPVLVNHEIRRFAQRFDGYAVRPRPAPGATPAGGAVDRRRTHVRAASRRKQALYISSPIGLGHARRDLAVADELRTLHPDLDIQWLAQDPVTRVLAARGESVHPASAHLASESGHVESESGEHDLHAFRALRRMDEILVNNFMVFDELMEREPFDLVIGDEAWDVDYFLHENPELKRARYAWFTDFVGWLPMPDGGDEEASLTADLNAEMLEQRARFRGLRDRSIFVGNPDDIVPDSFGPGLPSIREWTESEFDFAGYVTGFDPTAYDIGALRERLGHDQDERVCVVSVGGSGVGLPLLRRVLDAVPLARRVVPELRFVIVTGPRIDPRSLPETDGVEVVGFLPDLTEHLAASDVALTQGGLTTCMELTALRKPFLHVPLRHHFEQNFHVRRRLERYRAGTCLDYSLATDPDALASMLVKELDRAVDYRPVETDGAARAAAMLAELL